MAKDVAAKPTKKLSSISGMIDKLKNGRQKRSNQRTSADKNNIIQNIFHPDYILFDWEFFSRELEFE
jgi:hypothetical protein